MENKELNEQTATENNAIQQDKDNIVADNDNLTTDGDVVTEVESKDGAVDEIVEDVKILDEGEATIVDEQAEAVENEESDEFDHLSRAAIVDELDRLVNSGDMNEMRTHIQSIRVSFNKANKEFKNELEAAFLATAEEGQKFEYEADEVEQKFESLNNLYKQKRQEYLTEQENMKKANLAKRKELLERLKTLVDADEINKKVYDEFRELQETWRQVGIIPKEEAQEVWQSYHFVVERFFDKVRINNELRELDFKKNLEAKIELCEKAEELFLEENLSEMSRRLQALHAKWKEIGMVANDKRDEVWERFRTISEKLNARRSEYFAEKNKEFQANYEAKLALIEKAKEMLNNDMKSIKDWQAKTVEYEELFKLWKSIGRAAKEHNDNVWKEFRLVLDTFYTSKSDFFNRIKAEQNNNYNIKVDLCVKAEALKDSNDWGATSKELIKLQKEWKEVGPIPQRLSDKIWKRFRAACDEFFNAKAEFFSHVNENEEKNLEMKKELIEKVKTYEYTDDKTANLQVLKGFQKEWVNIGHVPMKVKDTIYKEFRQAVDQQMEKLGISTIDMADMNFKSRVESMKDGDGGDKAISKEVNAISNKIKMMKEEIALWENNIEFFSKSKNSELLRAEFERKIEKARKDLKVEELKLDYLNKEREK